MRAVKTRVLRVAGRGTFPFPLSSPSYTSPPVYNHPHDPCLPAPPIEGYESKRSSPDIGFFLPHPSRLISRPDPSCFVSRRDPPSSPLASLVQEIPGDERSAIKTILQADAEREWLLRVEEVLVDGDDALEAQMGITLNEVRRSRRERGGGAR